MSVYIYVRNRFGEHIQEQIYRAPKGLDYNQFHDYYKNKILEMYSTHETEIFIIEDGISTPQSLYENYLAGERITFLFVIDKNKELIAVTVPCQALYIEYQIKTNENDTEPKISSIYVDDLDFDVSSDTEEYKKLIDKFITSEVLDKNNLELVSVDEEVIYNYTLELKITCKPKINNPRTKSARNVRE